jgi:hypothetical protein
MDQHALGSKTDLDLTLGSDPTGLTNPPQHCANYSMATVSDPDPPG